MPSERTGSACLLLFGGASRPPQLPAEASEQSLLPELRWAWSYCWAWQRCRGRTRPSPRLRESCTNGAYNSMRIFHVWCQLRSPCPALGLPPKRSFSRIKRLAPHHSELAEVEGKIP